MWVAVWAALKRYYRIVASCSVLAGIVLAFFQDVHNVALDRLSALIWPPLPQEQTCVEDYFSDTIDRPPGSYLIIVTDMANDPDRNQSILIDRTLRRLYGEDLGSAIQMETIPCTIFSAAGNAAKRIEDAKKLALEITERAGADVVLWGEVIARDDLIALNLTHTAETGRADYQVEDNSLSTDFGEDLGKLIAAKMLTLSSLTSEQQGTYFVPRMKRVLTVTAPLIASMPPQMRDEDKAALLNAHSVALYYISLQSGDDLSLSRSIELRKEALSLIANATNPDAWASYNNGLGNALWTLGERSGSEDLLEQAITAFRAALTKYSQDSAPQKWARVQNNLANALAVLGDQKNSTELLEQSVTAYRAALTERTQEGMPLEWALTQSNFGNALKSLGERQGSEEMLEQAVAAYRAALTVRTQDRVPLDWAATQTNLGTALTVLGKRRNSAGLLEQAVTAHRAALTEYTQDRVPLYWATAQNGLGNALQALGERSGDEDQLEQAVTAYRAALTELTLGLTPVNWAKAQTNLRQYVEDVGREQRQRGSFGKCGRGISCGTVRT